MSRRPHSDQLATLTAHAAQLQTRLLVALDTLDSQSLAHASELAKLQESHDKLAARARRLEYERNTANEDLAEMTAVLELVIEKVGAANDYKVLAHSNLHLPSPLSPPRTRNSNRTSSHPNTPTDASAYTSALVSALTAQLDAARAQAVRERSDYERKIATLEAMVELRDVELKRNLGRSINGVEQSVVGVSMEAVASGSMSPVGMSRGEAMAAYEAVAQENERLEKEIASLRAKLTASDFNRATSEVDASSSWAQIPDWARPQSQPQPQSRTPSQNQPPSRPQSEQAKPKRPIRSGSSDQAPSSASENPASNSNSSFEQHVRGPRTRSSGSVTADPNRSRTPRPSLVFSGSESERGTGVGVVSRQEQTQPVGSRRNRLRDSGLGADSGTDTTQLRTRPSSSTSGRAKPGPKERERRPAAESTSTTSTQQQSEPSAIQLMPLLPALTPSKVRAPKVEVIDLPSTSYIEPSFGIQLTRRGAGPNRSESDSSTLEPPRSAALVPIPSPGLVSPIGDLALPPSVVTFDGTGVRGDQSSLAAPISLDSRVLLPSSIGQTSTETVRVTTVQTTLSLSLPPISVPDSNATPIPTIQPLQPAAPVLRPANSIFQPAPSLFPNRAQPQRSRSSSRTARLSPLPVFNLTGLSGNDTGPRASSTPANKAIPETTPSADAPEPISPTRRQSDPAPVSAPASPPPLRQRSNSAVPLPQPSRENSKVDLTVGGPPTTPPRSTNNTVQFAFITPVVDRTAEEPRPPTAGVNSTTAEPGTTMLDQASTLAAPNATNNATNNTTKSRRQLLPMFKFVSPSPGTPPSTRKRRANRAMTAPSQFGSSIGPASPGIASSPLARGRVVRESPLQLVMGAAHAGLRENMRIPIMREVGNSGPTAGPSTGTAGLVPPLVPTVPLVPLVAQLVPNAPPETQAALRGMQAERELLGRAQPVPTQEVTAESMAKVLKIEAECLRLRRDSAEAAALREEVMRLRAQLQQKEREQEAGAVEEQDYTTTTSTSHISDGISESAETYSDMDAESDDTAPTATEATLPEAHEGNSSLGRMTDVRDESSTKEGAAAELHVSVGGA
ncbi:hypothetical protein RhiJN_02361 [Ceratobasidium sp. AG-Ba]|nr:hypothetical protein RhiJN_02361 [Ceratobasidium sp. AG-Ba]QRW03292.1 hypothetical protein RhiLY_02291 [Ceratobasidium sp. AG-Ba]